MGAVGAYYAEQERQANLTQAQKDAEFAQSVASSGGYSPFGRQGAENFANFKGGNALDITYNTIKEKAQYNQPTLQRTDTITSIPAQKLTPPSSQSLTNAPVYQGPIKPGTSEQQFRENGKSVPLMQGPVQPNVDESAYRETGKQTLSTSQNLPTYEEYKQRNTVTLPKSTWQKYKEGIQDAGFFTATLDLFSGQAVKGYDVYAQKTGDYYQINSVEKLIGTSTRVGPYFTPIGPKLLIATGTESYLTPGGQAKIQSTKESLQGYGFGSLSNVAYAIPAAEIGLGALGTYAQVSEFYAAAELKAFNAAPTKTIGYRIEGEKGGIDILKSVKTTGKTEYTSKIVQPYYTTESGYTLEGGQGTAFKVQENIFNAKITATKFETGGRGLAKENPLFIKEFNGIKVSKTIPDAGGSIGRIYVKTYARGDYTLKGGMTGLGDVRVLEGTTRITTPSKTFTNFVGLGKEEGNFIGLIGGKATKGNYNVVSDTTKIMGKPDTFGILKKVKASDLISSGRSYEGISLGGNIGKGTITGTTTKLTAVGYQKAAVESSLATTLKAPVNIPKFSTGLGLASAAEYKPSQVQVQSQESITSTLLIPGSKADTSLAIKSKQNTFLIPLANTATVERTRQNNFAIPRTIQLLSPATKENTKVFTIPSVTQATKTEERTRQTTKLIPGNPLITNPFKDVPGFVPPIFPGMPKLFDYGFKKRGKSIKASSRYAPSVAAIGLNITAFKVPKSYKAGFGSLAIRPVIIGKRTKSKKQRRKKS